MHLHAHKVTQVSSPSPGVSEAPGHNHPVAGPSDTPQPPLFEEHIPSGSGEIGPEVPMPSGE